MSPAAQHLFGVEQESLVMVAESTTPWKWTQDESRADDVHPACCMDGDGPFSGLHPRAAYYVQSYATIGSEPVLRLGDKTTGVMRSCGEGTSWLLGTLFSYGILAEDCADTQEMLERVLSHAGVIGDTREGLIRQTRVCGDMAVWSILNPTGEIRDWLVGDVVLEDLLTGERFETGSVPIERYEIRCFVTSNKVDLT